MIGDTAKNWWLKRADTSNFSKLDFMLVDIVFVAFPALLIQMANWAVVGYIYYWLYNKYGFEKALIAIGITLIMSMGGINVAIRQAFR